MLLLLTDNVHYRSMNSRGVCQICIKSSLVKNGKAMYTFSAIAVPLSNAYYGAGTGPIYVDEINCIGNETNIGQCDRKPLGVNDCGHDEDAGVMCLCKLLHSYPISILG